MGKILLLDEIEQERAPKLSLSKTEAGIILLEDYGETKEGKPIYTKENCTSPQRLEGETYEQYKIRRAIVNKETKNRKRGVLVKTKK